MPRSVIDVPDLTTDELEALMDTAEDIIARPDDYADACRRKKLPTLFFEPSTRTRLSFEAAMYELGGNVLSVTGAGTAMRTSSPCGIRRKARRWWRQRRPRYR